MVGARSEPIASSAIRMRSSRLDLFHFESLHVPVVAAGRADAMRNVGIPAAGAGGHRRRLSLHVRAAFTLTLLRLTSFRNGHLTSGLEVQSNLMFFRAVQGLTTASSTHSQEPRFRSVPQWGQS